MTTQLTSAGVTFTDATTMNTAVDVVSVKPSSSLSSSSITLLDNIDANVKQITVTGNVVCSSTSAVIQLQVGDVTSYKTTGYQSTAFQIPDAVDVSSSSGFLIIPSSLYTASMKLHIVADLTYMNDGYWICSGAGSAPFDANDYMMKFSGYYQSASFLLTRVQLTTSAGTLSGNVSISTG